MVPCVIETIGWKKDRDRRSRALSAQAALIYVQPVERHVTHFGRRSGSVVAAVFLTRYYGDVSVAQQVSPCSPSRGYMAAPIEAVTKTSLFSAVPRRRRQLAQYLGCDVAATLSASLTPLTTTTDLICRRQRPRYRCRANTMRQPLGDRAAGCRRARGRKPSLISFEAIEVEQQHADHPPRLAGQQNRLVDAVVEQAAVGEPGQHVVRRVVLSCCS